MKYPEWKMISGIPSNQTAEKMHEWEMEAFVNAKEFINELRKYRKTVVLKDNFLEWQKAEEEIKNWNKPRRPKTVGQWFNSVFGGWWVGDEL